MDRVVDLVQLELEELVASIREPDAEQPFGVYVLASDHPAAELGRYVERDVFLEFFGNTPDLLRAEYDPYEAASLFFVCVDHLQRRPAGVMRVLLPTEVGFKTLHDLERVWKQPTDDVLRRTGIEWDPARLWDIATLAVARDYRGEATNGFVSFALYHAFSIAVHRCDIEWGVAVLDLVVLDLIQSQLFAPFSPFAGVEPMSYLDSPLSLPVWGQRSAWDARAAAADPELHALMAGGPGMEAAVAHPDWDRVVADVSRVTTLLPTPVR